jgi:transposase
MYPLDRRKLAIHIYARVCSLRKTASLLMVSHSTVRRWIQNPERKPHLRSSPKTTLIASVVLAAVEADPLITPRALSFLLCDELKISVSAELVRTVIRRHGYTRKKARFYGQPSNLAAKTAAFEAKRTAFLQQGRFFVSVDETSFGRHCAPVYGYALSGTPLRIKKNRPRCTTVSVVAAVTADGSIFRRQHAGSFNTDRFAAFLDDLQLPVGSVILLDNVSFHHSRRVKDIADLKGWDLLHTPPYSPWYNPIEGVFSIVKRSYYKCGDIDCAFQHASPLKVRYVNV